MSDKKSALNTALAQPGNAVRKQRSGPVAERRQEVP